MAKTKPSRHRVQKMRSTRGMFRTQRRSTDADMERKALILHARNVEYYAKQGRCGKAAEELEGVGFRDGKARGLIDAGYERGMARSSRIATRADAASRHAMKVFKQKCLTDHGLHGLRRKRSR